MLHSLKLQLAKGSDKRVLRSDQRLSETDERLRALLRAFPAVQSCVEENERAWGAVTYSVREAGAAYQLALAVDHAAAPVPESAAERTRALQEAADSLCSAAERLPSPRTTRGHGALRALNARARGLRAAQAEAVVALRNREYYAKKVTSLSKDASRARSPAAIAAARDRRARNEQKLAEADADVALRTDRIEAELAAVLARRHDVLAASMRAFVELQLQCYSPDPIAPVLATVPQVEEPDSLLACASSVESNDKSPAANRRPFRLRSLNTTPSAGSVSVPPESEWFASPQLTPNSSMADDSPKCRQV